jgi:hypothetical protein
MNREHKPRVIKKYAGKVRKLLRMQAEIKALYTKSDPILDELVERLRNGALVPLTDRKFARLRDNFADRNKVYRAHGISRFEIEVFEV